MRSIDIGLSRPSGGGRRTDIIVNGRGGVLCCVTSRLPMQVVVVVVDSESESDSDSDSNERSRHYRPIPALFRGQTLLRS